MIVHGCFAAIGQFRSLADVFAFHGPQTVCFNYDDRDSLEASSAELIQAVDALSKVMQQEGILKMTPPDSGDEFARFLTRLYRYY